jgi:hypothetical protein
MFSFRKAYLQETVWVQDLSNTRGPNQQIIYTKNFVNGINSYRRHEDESVAYNRP